MRNSRPAIPTASTPITASIVRPEIFRSRLMDSHEMIVEFDKYCSTCLHEKKAETEAPCDECLEHPVNWETNKPFRYERRT